jgi:hypothetical protein
LQQHVVLGGHEIQYQKTDCREQAADQHIAAPPAGKQREGVLDDADQRLEVPGNDRPEDERGIGLTADVKRVLEQVLDGDVAQASLGQRQRGGEHPEHHYNNGKDQGPVGVGLTG